MFLHGNSRWKFLFLSPIIKVERILCVVIFLFFSFFVWLFIGFKVCFDDFDWGIGRIWKFIRDCILLTHRKFIINKYEKYQKEKISVKNKFRFLIFYSIIYWKIKTRIKLFIFLIWYPNWIMPIPMRPPCMYLDCIHLLFFGNY